jgi:hypothetical protein
LSDEAIADPIQKLLVLGEPKYSRDFDWPDYGLLGITREHTSSLIDIATDPALFNLSDESDPRGWAPVHAWRALGQMKATSAIAPLMRLLHEVKDNDWVIEEIPDVFAMIGLDAFHPLIVYFNDLAYPVYSRLIAATSIMQIGLLFPEVRQVSIDTLSAQLEQFAQNRPGMNSVLIAQLVELGAAEKSELIHKVFAAGKVDRFIVGDWRDIKNRLNHSGDLPALGSKSALAKTVDAVPPDPASRPVYKEPGTRPHRRQQ